MRLYRTYILRLLVDTEAKDAAPELHGSLQAIGDQQTQPFKSGQGLLTLLRETIRKKAEAEIQDVNQEDE